MDCAVAGAAALGMGRWDRAPCRCRVTPRAAASGTGLVHPRQGSPATAGRWTCLSGYNSKGQRAGGPVGRSARGSEHPKGVEHPLPKWEVSPARVPPPPPLFCRGWRREPRRSSGARSRLHRASCSGACARPVLPVSTRAPAVSQPVLSFLAVGVEGPSRPDGSDGETRPNGESPAAGVGACAEGRGAPQSPAL